MTENTVEGARGGFDRWFVLKMFDLAVRSLSQDRNFTGSADVNQQNLLKLTNAFVNQPDYQNELKVKPGEGGYKHQPISAFFESMAQRIAKDEEAGLNETQIENSKRVLGLMKDFSLKLGVTDEKMQLKDVLRGSLSNQVK